MAKEPSQFLVHHTKISEFKFTKGLGMKIKWTGMEFINIRMGRFIGANGRIINRKGKDSMSSEMEPTTMENGETT